MCQTNQQHKHITNKPTTKSLELISFKLAISRDFKHKNTNPALPAPDLLAYPRSISTAGSIRNAILREIHVPEKEHTHTIKINHTHTLSNTKLSH